jgi:hypothetical protein
VRAGRARGVAGARARFRFAFASCAWAAAGCAPQLPPSPSSFPSSPPHTSIPPLLTPPLYLNITKKKNPKLTPSPTDRSRNLPRARPLRPARLARPLLDRLWHKRVRRVFARAVAGEHDV